jgi:hypothetical protein
MAYIRVFAYLNNIYRREGYEKHMPELKPYITKMMSMLDEDIVNKKLNKDMQKEYYKYVDKEDLKKQKIKKEKDLSKSPSDNEFNNTVLLNEERKYFQNQIKVIQSKNDELIKENTALSKNNNDLLLKNSKLKQDIIEMEKQLMEEKSQLNNITSQYEQ